MNESAEREALEAWLETNWQFRGAEWPVDFIRIGWMVRAALAPEPPSQETASRIYPPEFPTMPVNMTSWPVHDLWRQACLTGWRCAALAPVAQEPVAWGMFGEDGCIIDCICPEEHACKEGRYTVPLYTAPQP